MFSPAFFAILIAAALIGTGLAVTIMILMLRRDRKNKTLW